MGQPPPAEPQPAVPPPPTIPSRAAPVITLPGAPGLPPTATFELHPSIGLTEEYTDNFNLSDLNKEENLRTGVPLGLRFLINSPFTKGLISATMTPSHDTLTGDINLFASLTAQVSWQATPRLTLTATDVFVRSDAPGEADALSLRRERETFNSNTFSLRSEYRIGTVTTQEYYILSAFFGEGDGRGDTLSHVVGLSASAPFLEANTGTVGYEFLASEVSSGDAITGHRFSASVVRQLSLLASAGASAFYQTRDGGDSGSSATGDSWGGTVFGSYGIPGRWSTAASIGHTWYDTGASGLTASASVSYWFAQAVATLAYNQGFSETFVEGEDFGVVETRGVTGTLAYPFTPFLRGTASAFYRENQFTGIGGGGVAGDDETTWGGTLLFGVTLRSWLSLSLEYSYTDAESTGPRGGYTENRARAALLASF